MPLSIGPSSIPPSYNSGDSPSSKAGAVKDALAGKLTMPQVGAESLRTSRSSEASSVGEPLEIQSGHITPAGSKIDQEQLQASLRRLGDLDPREDSDALFSDISSSELPLSQQTPLSKFDQLQNQKQEKVEKHKYDLLEMGMDRLSATTSNTFTKTIKNKLLDIKLAVISFRHEKALNRLDKELARTSFNRPNLETFQEMGKNNVLQGQKSANINLNDMKEAFAKAETSQEGLDQNELPVDDLAEQVMLNIKEQEGNQVDLKNDLAAAEQVLDKHDNFLDLDDLINSLPEDESFDSVDFNDEMDAANRLLDRQDFDDLIESLPMDDPDDFSDLSQTKSPTIKNIEPLPDDTPDDFSDLNIKKPPVIKNPEPLSEDIKPKAGTWEARGETAPENKVSDLKKKFEDLK